MTKTPWYFKISGPYNKRLTIVNYDSSIINKLFASLTDDARVIIYNPRMFIVQATGVNVTKLFFFVTYEMAE
jgi:hypothetical protein